MNGFRAIFCIFLHRPLFLGEDGLRKAGGGKEGAKKREDWMAVDSIFGPACFREVLRYEGGTWAELMRLGDVGAYLKTTIEEVGLQARTTELAAVSEII
jgi:hypothetical protein